MIALARPSSAHPLGNFTINHLSEISLDSRTLNVRYVLDMAEIPSYQEMRERSADGRLDRAGIEAWGRDRAAAIAPSLVVMVDGAPTPLRLVTTSARTRPGAGRLPTLYLVATLQAAIAPGARHMTYADQSFAGRLGWRDVVVAPATEPTRELTAYPNALLGSPPDRTGAVLDRTASGVVTASAPAASDEAVVSAVPVSAVRSNLLSDLLAGDTGDWKVVVFTIFAAIALGGLHALEPGHGKTLLAVSLVGARATVAQAAILAGSLTVAHTIGVLGLGVAIEVFKGAFVPERIYPWITLVSGIAIAVIGARSIQRQVVAMQANDRSRPSGAARTDAEIARRAFSSHAALHASGAAHDHGAGGHGHDHGSLDDKAHARAHAIPGTAPLRFGPTVWAAMSGGIAPCPAALVVLLASVALNKVAFGIFVVIAFSLGLAGTLTGLGIAVVRGAAFLQRRRGFDTFVRFGPLASAIAIGTIGAVMVGQGFVEQGVRVSSILISTVTALAIAAFAFSRGPARRTASA